MTPESGIRVVFSKEAAPIVSSSPGGRLTQRSEERQVQNSARR